MKRKLLGIFWAAIGLIALSKIASNFSLDLLVVLDKFLLALLGLITLNFSYKIWRDEIKSKWLGFTLSVLVGSIAASYTMAFLIALFKYQSYISLAYSFGTGLITYACVESFKSVKAHNGICRNE
jgi:hypothetical protein